MNLKARLLPTPLPLSLLDFQALVKFLMPWATGSDMPLNVGACGADAVDGLVNDFAPRLGSCTGAAAGRLKAAGAAELVVIAVSEGAVLTAVAEAATSWLGAVIGWMVSTVAGGAGATSWPPGSSKSVRWVTFFTSTTLPRVRTSTKCSATEMVKNRERPSRSMKAPSQFPRVCPKEKAAIRGTRS